MVKQFESGEQFKVELTCTPQEQETFAAFSVNHLEERLLDQAQARASYTPLFWGRSRSIPQGMIFDVQPLVKSFFCPIRESPNGFFILRPLSPETGYHILGMGGGGSKVCAQKAPSSGEAWCCHNKPRSNGTAADCRILGWRSEPWSVDCGRWRRHHVRPTGVQTADQKVCGQLHYHSGTACPVDHFPPH